jgi:2-aminoadipate transaminase
MPTRFAKRMDVLKASEIREILKVTVRPEVISFAGGLPAPELFPVDDLGRAAKAVLERSGREALQYSTTQGHAPLREAIARRMARAYGSTSNPDDILVTSGSQQGLDLTAKLFLDDGDVVLCESPTYIGMTQAFSVFRPRFVEVPVDDEGMVPDALEHALLAHPEAKLLYTIPTFQNPTGRTWSASRRRAVMELATAHDIPVIEDNPYGELRFEGVPTPLLRQFDPQGLVIYLGTFSKVFCPGLRLAWVEGRSSFIEKLVLLKQGADLHTSTEHARGTHPGGHHAVGCGPSRGHGGGSGLMSDPTLEPAAATAGDAGWGGERLGANAGAQACFRARRSPDRTPARCHHAKRSRLRRRPAHRATRSPRPSSFGKASLGD